MYRNDPEQVKYSPQKPFPTFILVPWRTNISVFPLVTAQIGWPFFFGIVLNSPAVGSVMESLSSAILAYDMVPHCICSAVRCTILFIPGWMATVVAVMESIRHGASLLAFREVPRLTWLFFGSFHPLHWFKSSTQVPVYDCKYCKCNHNTTWNAKGSSVRKLLRNSHLHFFVWKTLWFNVTDLGFELGTIRSDNELGCTH